MRNDDDLIELYHHGSGEEQENALSYNNPRRRSNQFRPRTITLQREDSRSFIPLNEDDSGSVRLEQHAAEIVRRMEEDDTLMEDNPISEHLRMETLRDMPQCLTLKRSIKARLSKSVSRKSKRHPIGFFKRCKYQISMTFEKFQTATKNLIYSLELWYSSLKTIEGHFGSGVATYFKFLRWIFVMNFLISIPALLFLVIPQVIHQSSSLSPVQAKQILLMDENNQTSTLSQYQYKDVGFSFADIITGEGYLTYTTLFYGFYTNETITIIPHTVYSVPYAYFFTMLFCYVISFFVLSISMARSYRKSFIETSGGLKNIYAHKIFCGWDFGIATKEGAELKSKAIYNELKELLCDENQEIIDTSFMFKFWTRTIQVVVHLFIYLLLGGIAYLMWVLLKKHRNNVVEENSYLGSASVITALVVTIIMTFGPFFFTWIIKYEDYKNPRTVLYISLLRTFILELVVIGVLIIFWLTQKSEKQQCWETSLGQEVYRLILIDFIISVVFTALVELVRVLIYKYVWRKIGMSEFDIASNTLQIIYNQTLFWVGFYFSPLLAVVVTLKFWCTWYLKRLSCLHLCKPSSKPWRAAQTQTIFLVTTFLALFAVVIVHGYIITQKKTSKCGPFQSYAYMYEMFINDVLQIQKDHGFMKFLVYLTKPGVVMGLLIIMSVRVYYLHAKSKAQGSMVEILRQMLVVEARDKEFLLTNISKITGGEWIYNLDRSAEGRSSNRYTEPSNTWDYREDDTVRRLPRYDFNNINQYQYGENPYEEIHHVEQDFRPRRNRNRE